MKQKIIFLFTLFIFLQAQNSLFSQSTDTATDTTSAVVEDKDTTIEDEKFIVDTTVNRNNFNVVDDSIVAYKNNKDFAYMHYLDSLLRKTRELKMDTISSQNLNSKYRKNGNNSSQNTEITISSPRLITSPFIRILLWILAIFFIGFIIYKLFLSEGLFKKKTRELKSEAEENEEEKLIEEGGYELLIKQAITNKNLRLAVRYLYLQTLQKLTASGVINYTADKTNYEYVREIAGKKYQKEFASLTLNYEYVWYGKFDVNDDIFYRLQNDFKTFQQKV